MEGGNNGDISAGVAQTRERWKGEVVLLGTTLFRGIVASGAKGQSE